MPSRLQGAPERAAAAGPESADSSTAASLAAISDRPDVAAELERRRRAPVGESSVPSERYWTALQRMRAMPRHSTRQNRMLPSRAEAEERGAPPAESQQDRWTWLGPGNIGGRTRALVVDPAVPRILYAAGVSGGVFKSVDRGATWTVLTDSLPNLAVSSLAMDPTNRHVIYAGTGEGYGTFDSVRGLGIFRTTDGGASWTLLPATAVADFYYVNKIAISKQNSLRIYAATGTGVWRTSDGGASWTRILDPRLDGGCFDLALRGDQPPDDILFASCGTGGLYGQNTGPAADGTVFRSLRAQLDGPGGAFQPVLHEEHMGLTSLAIAPSAPNVIYAVAANNSSNGGYWQGLHAVFRSLQGGAPGTWKPRVRNDDANRLNTLLLTILLPVCDLDKQGTSGLGFYANTIAVDPLDPRRVWVGGVDLFRSDDGGRNWGIASYWWGHGVDGTAQGSYVPGFAHADQHVIVFDPRYDGVINRTLYVGGDGGVYKTLDARAPVARGADATCSAAATGMAWKPLNHGYGVTQIYHGTPYADGTGYVAGTQDNGFLLGRDAAGPDGWQMIAGNDVFRAVVSPDDTNVLYEIDSYGFKRSMDGGASFVKVDQKIDFSLFAAPLILDPNDSSRLWIGGSALWRSDDRAATWKQASAPYKDLATALAVAPGNSDVLLAGTNAGQVLSTSTARSASSGTVLSTSLPRSGYVSSIAFDPERPDVVYAAYSSFGGTHVWKSQDGGHTWAGIDGSGQAAIPDVPVHTVIVDPHHGSTLYAGSDLGVFVSLDGGDHWAVEANGFPNVVTSTLALATNAKGQAELFAFTYGRGVFKVTLPGP
ncbi:MAG TPA: hypothetical protein VHQ90_04745 [Thermoanaerobaculia bacterium]|nr:hypothetical protein [Thermoanaerobaculia bacterium]